MPVSKDTKINFKTVPALEKLTVQQQRWLRKPIVSSAVMDIVSKGWWEHKEGGPTSPQG